MKRSATRNWARAQFQKYRGSVAFVETQDKAGNTGIGTCFHIGEGVFVTARHVVEGQIITKIGFDDGIATLQLLEKPENWGDKTHGAVTIVKGPFTHTNSAIDVACFKCEPYPKSWIPLGDHLDDMLGQYDLVLHKILLLGYPPIPFSDRPALVAGAGEINASIDKYTGGHSHFIVSTMARGGFSGGPALVAYDEDNEENGTAVLGLVTESLSKNDQAAELGYMAILTVDPIYECLNHHGLLPGHQKLFIDIA